MLQFELKNILHSKLPNSHQNENLKNKEKIKNKTLKKTKKKVRALESYTLYSKYYCS